MITEMLKKYLHDHSRQKEPVLEWLERETHYRCVHPRMLSGEPLGSFLSMLVKMIRPRNILEIGTFTGYSSICMGRGLSPEGRIDTIEIFDEHNDLIIEAFRRSGLESQIHLHTGNALEVIPGLRENGYSCQLAYIDGNKREYCDYYREVKKVLEPGGYIIADNVLWDGKVADPKYKDPQTAGLRAYNILVLKDPEVTTVLLPLGDGLSICRKDGPASGNPTG